MGDLTPNPEDVIVAVLRNSEEYARMWAAFEAAPDEQTRNEAGAELYRLAKQRAQLVGHEEFERRPAPRLSVWQRWRRPHDSWKSYLDGGYGWYGYGSLAVENDDLLVAAHRRIVAAPGHRLLVIAEFLFSRRTMDEILGPAMDDMRREYNESLAAGRPRKAQWARIRGTWSFLAAAGLIVFTRFGRLFLKAWRLVP